MSKRAHESVSLNGLKPSAMPTGDEHFVKAQLVGETQGKRISSPCRLSIFKGQAKAARLPLFSFA
jgi:hypothetical protein